MNKVNEIIFSKDRYGNNREKMFQAVAQQLMILFDNDYVCKVYDDDFDIIVIEFGHDERRDAWGCDELLWLTPEEIEAVENFRLNQIEEIEK